MKLNPEQIDRLYTFTREHYVTYYDLQTELVDHLANGIEVRCTNTPELSFEEALDLEFKSFGIFGFSDIIEKRSWTLEKKYWRFIKQNLYAFFKPPRILFSVSLIWIIYEILKKSITQHTYWLFIFIVPLFFFGVKSYHNSINYRKRIRETQRRWMLEERIFGYGSGFILLNFITQILLNSRFIFYMKELNLYLLITLSLILALFYILAYLIIFYLPNKAHLYLSAHYPEYNLSL